MEKRDKQYRLRLSEEEHKELVDKANKLHLNVADLIRDALDEFYDKHGVTNE